MKTYSLTTTFFDFRKPRVKTSRDGVNWYVCDKFGLCYVLRHIDYFRYLYFDNVYTYKGCKDALLNEFQKYNFPNVTILK